MSSISKTVFIDKLYYVVNKYDNTYHSTIKILTLVKKLIIKI